jgi:hypothetical protein
MTYASMFRTGEVATYSGTFAVVQSQHHIDQIVTLSEGDKFPGCARCSEVLTFWVLARHEVPGGHTAIEKLPTTDRNPETPPRRPSRPDRM